MQGDRRTRESDVLVGRDRELETLRSLLDRTVAGRLSLVVVEGPRGSGKSRLLHEFVTIAHRCGVATAREADWIGGTGMWRIVASGRHDGPSGPGVSAGPRLLTCEHPQWIHSRVWPELEAIAHTVPLLVVLTRRTGANWPEPDSLAAVAPHRVPLGPLSGPAVSALLGSLVGGVPDPALRGLAEVAGGNPQAIEDLVTGLNEECLLRVSSGRASVEAVRLPTRTRARLDATLAALSPATRHLVQVASTLGARFDLRDLAALLHRSAATLVPAVHEAIASGLVVGLDDALRFRHELVRATAEESLPRPVRLALRDERAPRTAPAHTRAAHRAPASPTAPAPPAGLAVLTEQERRIAVLVGYALTNQQIARRIDRSPHTVNYHLRQIFRKLGVTSRVEVASFVRDVADPGDDTVTA